MPSIEDKQFNSFEQIEVNKFARRVVLDDLNAAVPQNWKGITQEYDTDDNLVKVYFYSDAAKTTLIKTITITYTDGLQTGVTSV